MRYLKGTLDCVLRYAANNYFRLYGYANSYWEGSDEDKRALQDFVSILDQV